MIAAAEDISVQRIQNSLKRRFATENSEGPRVAAVHVAAVHEERSDVETGENMTLEELAKQHWDAK